MLLKDNTLRKEVVDLIIAENINAVDAFTVVIDKYIDKIKNSSTQYLQERYLDFLDIKTRVLRNFNSTSLSLSNLEECILLIDELYPTLLLNISKNVKGIIAKHGGLTSHSAILCRMHGITYVVADIPKDYKGNIIIDKNIVYLNPDDSLIREYSSVKEEKIIKPDLKDINIYANIASNEDIERMSGEFTGVGLYRTEFLIMDSLYAFDYKKQAEVYEQALNILNGKSITFRTFDLGGDKQVDYLPRLKKGVINYYEFPKLFETQIKALLLANEKFPNKVKIMFPMIENFKQYQQLKKLVVKIAREQGQKVPPIGMMLETQSALINLEEFKNVDFISIGTNDLTSELFNLSRDELILFDDFYDSLLEIIERVVSFSNKNNIEVSVCGELISEAEFAKKAIALGLKNISISPNYINNVYKGLSGE